MISARVDSSRSSFSQIAICLISSASMYPLFFLSYFLNTFLTSVMVYLSAGLLFIIFMNSENSMPPSSLSSYSAMMSQTVSRVALNPSRCSTKAISFGSKKPLLPESIMSNTSLIWITSFSQMSLEIYLRGLNSSLRCCLLPLTILLMIRYNYLSKILVYHKVLSSITPLSFLPSGPVWTSLLLFPSQRRASIHPYSKPLRVLFLLKRI